MKNIAKHAVAGFLFLSLAVLFPGIAPGAEGAPAPAGAGSPKPAAGRVKLSDLFGDDVVARGKGVEVRRSLLDQTFTAYRASMAARGQTVPEDKRVASEAQLLQRLVVTQALTNRVTPDDVKMALEAAQRKLKESLDQAGSPESFSRQLKAAGLNEEAYRRTVTEEAFAQTVVQRELASIITISDARIKDLYDNGNDTYVGLMQADVEKASKDPTVPAAQLARMKEQVELLRKENRLRLEQPERVHVSHIFMTTKDRKTEEPLSEEQMKFKRMQLERIRKRAVDGEDFAKLVMAYSEDRGIPETKGEYTFSRQDPWPPEFKAAAFSLQPGKVSDVVDAKMGLHVIKLLEVLPAKKYDFEKIAPDLKEFLKQQELQRVMPDYFARVRKEAKVEILDPKYEKELAADDAARAALKQ